MNEVKKKPTIDAKNALSRLQQLCSKQEKCTWDVYKKLNEWQVSQEDSEVILNSLYRDNFVDDDRYLISFIREKVQQNKWGQKKIAYSLFVKLFDSGAIEKAFADFEKEFDVKGLVREELLKKLKILKYKDAWDLRVKLQNFAASRGYENNLAAELIQELITNEQISKPANFRTAAGE